MPLSPLVWAGLYFYCIILALLFAVIAYMTGLNRDDGDRFFLSNSTYGPLAVFKFVILSFLMLMLARGVALGWLQ